VFLAQSCRELTFNNNLIFGALAFCPGPTCGSDINECVSSPCKNRGQCRNLKPGFACDCLPGFTGSTCEKDIDDCSPGACPKPFVASLAREKNCFMFQSQLRHIIFASQHYERIEECCISKWRSRARILFVQLCPSHVSSPFTLTTTLKILCCSRVG